MENTVSFLNFWIGIIVLLVIAVLGIIFTLAGSSTREERKGDGQDDEHYVMRQPIGRIGKPLIILAIGIAVEFVLCFVQGVLPEDYVWVGVVAKLAAAVIFGLIFWRKLADVLRRRVYVNGDSIKVTTTGAKSFETTFSQIRTVANVHSHGGIVGKKVKTKEGNQFEVLNTMSSYELFCQQLDAKVELPNLTHKLFKGKDQKKEENEDAWAEEPGVAPEPVPVPEPEPVPVPEPEPVNVSEPEPAQFPLPEFPQEKEAVPLDVPPSEE